MKNEEKRILDYEYLNKLSSLHSCDDLIRDAQSLKKKIQAIVPNVRWGESKSFKLRRIAVGVYLYNEKHGSTKELYDIAEEILKMSEEFGD